MVEQTTKVRRNFDRKAMLGRKAKDEPTQRRSSEPETPGNGNTVKPEKWSFGILNDKETDEVPGSVLLLSKVSNYNEPLGMQMTPARTSSSSLPYQRRASVSSATARRKSSVAEEVKYTKDGKFVLEPQPTDSANDPLNWPVLRRDLALVSLGLYCMIGGGMTPILAAGFNEVSRDLDVTVPDVALTTGLYMMGLGLGSIVLSPTAILYGKRPVYFVASICFIVTSIWCAVSPNYISLLVARIFQGFAVSSVECLPSASIAEIYFLHEKAYRLGIYTLLLLGGKNLVPLVSAAIIQQMGWRWVFWIVAIVVAFCSLLLFLFVPETFWDRAPIPHKRKNKNRTLSNINIFHLRSPQEKKVEADDGGVTAEMSEKAAKKHAHFGPDDVSSDSSGVTSSSGELPVDRGETAVPQASHDIVAQESTANVDENLRSADGLPPAVTSSPAETTERRGRPVSEMPTIDSVAGQAIAPSSPRAPSVRSIPVSHSGDIEQQSQRSVSPAGIAYTRSLKSGPTKSVRQQLKLWNGRLSSDKWWRVAVRPFLLFSYPSILWSALIYAMSIGWLIVLSECVGHIFEARDTYNFTPLQVGLVYISPFIGGIIGTAIAGKVSDVIVRFMARRNGGIYEPEFRLVMAIPIAISTVAGLMGFGWSIEERDNWIVPTVFFGIISFGCSLGSTTSITFAVDSYRQYAGEALVTLNVSKNILHGLVWSLFFNRWLEAEGSRLVFNCIGGIQLACLLTTIPMYIWGKRGRMWTVRRNLMEKF
jgi:MFS family permease